jgi:hypothetical protein
MLWSRERIPPRLVCGVGAANQMDEAPFPTKRDAPKGIPVSRSRRPLSGRQIRGGGDVRVLLELDPIACETLRKNQRYHPAVILEGDIGSVSGRQLRRLAGVQTRPAARDWRSSLPAVLKGLLLDGPRR